MKHINFAIDSALYKRVKLKAIKEGLTLRALLIEALINYLKTKQ